jgi:AmmeMemoRadiSam system protein B/AmmeMemoRadiSam system protein A
MKRKTFFSFLIFLFLCTSLGLGQGIRKPVWEGKFYDSNPEVLSAQIDRFLRNAKVSPPPGKLQALIIPHAGYVYSGQIAAHGYKLIEGKNYETVIIIAPSHRYGFEGCSIYPQGGYETPLGVADVDRVVASELSKASGFKYIPQAHQAEHSVEVQVPFIQQILPQAKIVPVVMGFPQRETIFAMAKALAKVAAERKVLVIASTDLSHFEPRKTANEIDARTISLIESFKTNTLMSKLERRANIMCGGGPVVAVLLYAQKRGEAKVQVLQYGDSSQAGGPASQVVGYLAAAVYTDHQPPNFSLAAEEKKELLRLARTAVEQFVKEKKIIDYQTQNSNFINKKGAFVTLKKSGHLRGCIGFIEPVLPLYETIIRASVYAAVQDPRFPPVSPEELKDLQVEISVLTPLERIHDSRRIQVGKHGLIISKNGKKGLLLPQVPVENNWSREEFLSHACLKAGLPEDAWKKGAELYVFEALVF